MSEQMSDQVVQAFHRRLEVLKLRAAQRQAITGWEMTPGQRAERIERIRDKIEEDGFALTPEQQVHIYDYSGGMHHHWELQVGASMYQMCGWILDYVSMGASDDLTLALVHDAYILTPEEFAVQSINRWKLMNHYLGRRGMV